MLKNLILNQIKNKLQTKVDFNITHCEFKINYLKDNFTLSIFGTKDGKEIEKDAHDKISNNSEIAEMLKSKIKQRTGIDAIDKIYLHIDFSNKKTKSVIYYQKQNEHLQTEIENVF